MVVTIILINVGIFILDAFSDIFVANGAGTGDSAGAVGNLNPLGRFLALESDVFFRPWKLWTLLSYGFAHASMRSDIFHIGGNMLVLFFLGRPIEQRLGRREFLKFYLVAIVVAGLVFVVAKFSQETPAIVVGASGAVSAVVALFIFCYPRETLLLFGILPMPAWLLGVLLLFADLSRAFDPTSPVAWQSHLGGFAFGAAYFKLNWSFHWLRLERLGELFKSRPKLKIHQPADNEKLKLEADAILEKINEHGESSLSSRERKVLKRYSEQIRRKRK